MSTIRRATPGDRDRLLQVWLRSVRATHAFLGEPAAFMGLDGAALEALFVDPAHFRKGAGKRLLDHARQLKGPLTVDVNEQNPQGLAFYLQSGFVQAGRSERDSAGRPFPILHLREAHR